jgi:hypothetical protein
LAAAGIQGLRKAAVFQRTPEAFFFSPDPAFPDSSIL